VQSVIPDGAPVAVVAGRYRLRELVGTGGVGTVSRASDELLGREVALKQVRLTDQPMADVARAGADDARIEAALNHPHIVSIFDVVLEGGEPWLVLEFRPSRSLGSALAERGTLLRWSSSWTAATPFAATMRGTTPSPCGRPRLNQRGLWDGQR
jgi:serine/threonine protein kinase